MPAVESHPVSLKSQLRVRLGPTYRRWRKRLDNPEVKQARLLAARLRAGDLDVLHLGASESQYVAPYDTDTRTLPSMIADALSPGLSTYSVNNPGYHPKLFKAYLDIVERSEVRPIVVLGLAVRFGFPAWAKHPEYGYERSLRALTRIDPGSPPWRFHAPVRLTRASDFPAHDRIEYPTVDGISTIGDFRRALKDTSADGLRGDERTRRIFAFHQGSIMGPDFLEEVTALGRRLHEMRLKVVVYQLPIPVDRGVQVLGEKLRSRTIDNLGLLDSAFLAGYGPTEVLQTGTLLDSDEFIDPNDAIEHVNERGRKRMVDLITDAVHQRNGGESERSA